MILPLCEGRYDSDWCRWHR